MVSAIGLDIVEVARIERDISRFGERFVNRILGRSEIDLFEKRQDREIFLAGRFAAKEAVIKALGRYLRDRPPMNVIEIVNDPDGRPELRLPPDIQNRLAGAPCLLSISHEKNYAVAVAILVEDK